MLLSLATRNRDNHFIGDQWPFNIPLHVHFYMGIRYMYIQPLIQNQRTHAWLDVVDRGFNQWPDQTKDDKIGICCFSAKHTALRRKYNKYNGVSIMCQSRVTCLPVDYRFSKLVQYKSKISMLVKYKADIIIFS